MFKEEFSGLPEGVREHLEAMLEEQVRALAQAYQWSLQDPSQIRLHYEQVCGKIHSVFDLASRFKRT